MSNSFDRATRVNPGYKKPSFSLLEIRDILISIAVLTVAFTLIFSRSNPTYFSTDHTTNILYWILVSLALVVSSFILHEFGHKFTAQRFGAWSEYRMFPAGLGACLVLSFFGILFAAPGAVYIRGRIDDRMNGIISAAGPGVNIVLSIAALCMAIFTNGMTSGIFLLLSYLNAFLALFNLIPVMPLDGSKILKWNIPTYIIMIVLAGVLLYINLNPKIIM